MRLGSFSDVVRALAATAEDGKPFTMEQLLPVHCTGSPDVPAYQVYMAIGYLQSVGLVDKRGRGAYSIKSVSTLQSDVWYAMEAAPTW